MSPKLQALIPGQALGAGSDLWEYWRITMEFTKQISLQSMWEKQCQANKQRGPDVALKVNPHAHCVCLNMLWYSLSSLPQSCCSPSCWSQLSGVFELQQEIPARHRPVDSRTWFGLIYSSAHVFMLLFCWTFPYTLVMLLEQSEQTFFIGIIFNISENVVALLCEK